jgi:hypothetical protein
MDEQSIPAGTDAVCAGLPLVIAATKEQRKAWRDYFFFACLAMVPLGFLIWLIAATHVQLFDHGVPVLAIVCLLPGCLLFAHAFAARSNSRHVYSFLEDRIEVTAWNRSESFPYSGRTDIHPEQAWATTVKTHFAHGKRTSTAGKGRERACS